MTRTREENANDMRYALQHKVHVTAIVDDILLGMDAKGVEALAREALKHDYERYTLDELKSEVGFRELTV